MSPRLQREDVREINSHALTIMSVSMPMTASLTELFGTGMLLTPPPPLPPFSLSSSQY